MHTGDVFFVSEDNSESAVSSANWVDPHSSVSGAKVIYMPTLPEPLYVQGAILYAVEYENVKKSWMTKLYRYMTVRNVNTVLKIYQLMQNAI
ncbi:hypothetical protein [Paenibacillus sp. BAC0078]